MDFFEPFWEAVLECHEKTGQRYVLWGVGYCESKSHNTRGAMELLDEVVGRADLAALRDQRTYDQFQRHPHVSLIPCPSMAAIREDAWRSSGVKEASPYLLQVDHPGLLGELSALNGGLVQNQIYDTCTRAAADLGIGHRCVSNLTTERLSKTLVGRGFLKLESLENLESPIGDP